MKIFLIAISVLFLTACDEEISPVSPDMEVSREIVSGDWQIIQETMFYDQLAYSGSRKIFRFVNLKTGQEFIGVTGVGISEVGSHTVTHGKTSSRRTDER